MVLTYAKNEDVQVFGPLDQETSDITEKLAGLKPADVTLGLSYHEKVTLMTVMIDIIHETNEFRLFLNRRVEDKSAFNKEKMDIYQQIRDLETKQHEFIKQYAEDETNVSQEQMSLQLEELRAQVITATRVEAKPLKQQILSLERKKNYYSDTLHSFEEQTKRKQA